MPQSLPEDRSATIGNSTADPNRSIAKQRTLFPDLLAILREEIDPKFKEVCAKLYPRLSNEQAAAQLSRNLSGRDNRKIGVNELDDILDVLGPDSEVRVLGLLLERRGFKSPERKPDPVRVQEELHGVKQGLDQLKNSVMQLAAAVERIEGGVR